MKALNSVQLAYCSYCRPHKVRAAWRASSLGMQHWACPGHVNTLAELERQWKELSMRETEATKELRL